MTLGTMTAIALLCRSDGALSTRIQLRCQQDYITCVEKKAVPKSIPPGYTPPSEDDRLTECVMERKL